MSAQKRAKQTSKPQSKPRNNTKLTGERSEAAFLNRAAALGFGVAKPWGDSLRYDFILDNGARSCGLLKTTGDKLDSVRPCRVPNRTFGGCPPIVSRCSRRGGELTLALSNPGYLRCASWMGS
jgi:PD-(D/E)XK endonuclease